MGAREYHHQRMHHLETDIIFYCNLRTLITAYHQVLNTQNPTTRDKEKLMLRKLVERIARIIVRFFDAILETIFTISDLFEDNIINEYFDILTQAKSILLVSLSDRTLPSITILLLTSIFMGIQTSTFIHNTNSDQALLPGSLLSLTPRIFFVLILLTAYISKFPDTKRISFICGSTTGISFIHHELQISSTIVAASNNILLNNHMITASAFGLSLITAHIRYDEPDRVRILIFRLTKITSFILLLISWWYLINIESWSENQALYAVIIVLTAVYYFIHKQISKEVSRLSGVSQP